jgi:hypothetical protein
MSGTSGVLERANVDFSFSVLAGGNSMEFITSIKVSGRVINQEIQSRSAWPDHDLFDSQ